MITGTIKKEDTLPKTIHTGSDLGQAFTKALETRLDLGAEPSLSQAETRKV